MRRPTRMRAGAPRSVRLRRRIVAGIAVGLAATVVATLGVTAVRTVTPTERCE
mgnify:CR=1 FL=1